MHESVLFKRMKNPAIKFAYAGLVALALTVRIIAASLFYPTPGDAGHFIQHAVTIASTGDWTNMSTYWSQGMIAAGVAGIAMGWNPHHAMQYLSCVSGVLLVLFSVLLCWQIWRSHAVCMVAGFLVATLPPLVHYSAVGYSEMTFMMLIMGAVFFLRLGLVRWRYGLPLSGLFMGAAFYFKGADAMVTAFGLVLYALWFHRERVKAHVVLCLITLLIVAGAAAPLFIYTGSKQGTIQPGGKIMNLALGRDWRDSKAAWGLKHEWHDRRDYLNAHGTAGFIWTYKQHLMKRVILNSADYVRLLNDALFKKTFRMGTGWFLLFALMIVWLLIRYRRNADVFLPLVCICASSGPMLLFFFHERIMVPVLPFYLILIGAGIGLAYESALSLKRKTLVGLLVASFVSFNAWHSTGFADYKLANWNYENYQTVAGHLRKYGGDELIVMSNGGVSVHFYTNNPLRSVALPYGSIDEVEAFAKDSNVDLIAISDQPFPHWPISGVFSNPTKLHPDWRILEDVLIPGVDWNIPSDRWLIIARPGYNQSSHSSP